MHIKKQSTYFGTYVHYFVDFYPHNVKKFIRNVYTFKIITYKKIFVSQIIKYDTIKQNTLCIIYSVKYHNRSEYY